MTMTTEALRQLVALTLVSSAVIALVLLIRRPVCRMFGAAAAYRAWLLVPISIAAVLLPGTPGAGFELVYVQMHPVYSFVERSLQPPPDMPTPIDWSLWAIVAWLVGATIVFAYLAGLQRAYVKSLGSLSEAHGTLRAQTAAGCPALLGVIRPKVVLPRDFESRYTTQEQTLVLAHEEVHMQRRDTLWNALVVLLRCVFWFNPLVHAAAGLMRVDQELACDAAVIGRHPGARRAYADAMLKTELADAALPVGCHWRSSHPFKERLHMLKTNLPGRARRALGGAIFAVAAVAVGYAAWAAEPANGPTLSAAPGAAPGGTQHLALHKKGLLKFGPNAQIQTFANVASSGPNGTQILEGDVRVTIVPPAGKTAMAHTVKVIKTPEGEQRVETDQMPPHSLTVTAEKVTITPAQDGSVTIEFDDGEVDTH